jgi:hypothetical protein
LLVNLITNESDHKLKKYINNHMKNSTDNNVGLTKEEYLYSKETNEKKMELNLIEENVYQQQIELSSAGQFKDIIKGYELGKFSVNVSRQELKNLKIYKKFSSNKFDEKYINKINITYINYPEKLDLYSRYPRITHFKDDTDKDIPVTSLSKSTISTILSLSEQEREKRLRRINNSKDYVFKNQLEHNHISAPRTCPEEHVDITSIAQKYTNVYQDIVQVFERAQLPRLFAGEDTQNMTSCWLTNFAEAADSLVYVPTETVYFGRRTHITEKTFKAIALEMPFVLVAPAGSLEYLREYGFQTFADIFDESYDQETDDIKRIERVVKLLRDLDELGPKERQQIHRACLPIVEHNYNHFYRGGLTDVLWTELTTMLDGLRV